MQLIYRLSKQKKFSHDMSFNSQFEIITIRAEHNTKDKIISIISANENIFILVFCSPEFIINKEVIKSDFKEIMHHNMYNIERYNITILSINQLLAINNITYEQLLRFYVHHNLKKRSATLVFDFLLNTNTQIYGKYKINVVDLLQNQLQILSKFNKYLKEIQIFDYSLINKILYFIEYGDGFNYYNHTHKNTITPNDLTRAKSIIKSMRVDNINNDIYQIDKIENLVQFIIDNMHSALKNRTTVNDFSFTLNGCKLSIKLSSGRLPIIIINIAFFKNLITLSTPYCKEFRNFLKLLSNNDRDIVLSKFELYKLKNL
jgi:hypothetical protein